MPLGEAARALIDALPDPCDPDAFLFPRHAGGRGAYSLTKCWRTVCEGAELGGLRLHDLRHSWASRALALGESLSMIGKLLGHTSIETTARYAHLQRDTERASAAKVGGSIGSDLLSTEEAEGSPWPS